MKKFIIPIAILLFLNACEPKQQTTTEDWKTKIDKRLPILGHRNWILVVDKAYPEQTTPGIETINTNEDLLTVLNYVKNGIKNSTHVNAAFYTDKELGFINRKQVPTIDGYRDSLNAILGSEKEVIPHDSVFVKIDEATKLFKVLVIKTNQIIPYSSVFIRLNCAYWDAKREKELRDSINIHSLSNGK